MKHTEDRNSVLNVISLLDKDIRCIVKTDATNLRKVG